MSSSWSLSAFEHEARVLVEVSKSMNDNWRLVTKCGQLLLLKDQVLSLSNSPKMLIEYHVSYNLSYGVPVLLMLVSEAETGVPINPTSLSFFSDMISKQLLSQQMHPLLPNLAVWQMHPCRTSEALDVLLKEDNTCFLLPWLSLVGQEVGLQIHPEMMVKHRKLLLKEHLCSPSQSTSTH